MTKELTYEQYKQLIEEQGQGLLDFLAFAASGDLEREIEVPEGIDVFTDLAIGLSYLIDDLRVLVERERQAQVILEQRVAARTQELEAALAEVRAVQRRYIEREWTTYASDALIGDEVLPLAWAPVVETAVLQQQTTMHSNGETALAVPVRYADEVIGVLGFGGESDEIDWGESDFAAVEAIVEQVGFALENQRLFDQTQAALNESSNLYEASAAINAAQSFEEILDVIRRFTIANNAQSVSLSLFDRPWTDTEMPDWVEIVSYYTRRQNQVVPSRFPLSSFPSASSILNPDHPALIEDFDNPPVEVDQNTYLLYTKQFGVRAAIFAPLVVGGQWIGYVNVLYKDPTRFPDADTKRLSAIASQAAVAIQNVISVAKTQARADELRVLNEMSRALTTMLDPQEILNSIHDYVSRLLDASNFFIAQFDASTREISYPYALENGEPVNIASRPFGNGLTEYVISHAMPLLIENNVGAWLEEKGLDLIGDSADSWMGVPMISGRQVIGVIGVQHPQGHQFNDGHLNLLISVASQTTIALQNARLFQQTQARAQREQKLREVTARVRSSADVDTILRTAVKEIGQALGRRTYIQLGADQDENPLAAITPKDGAEHESRK